MIVFADTNWLEALYIEADPNDSEAISRREIVLRRMRKQSLPLTISHVVLLEAHNLFTRIMAEPQPAPWQHLLADFQSGIFVDTMHWDFVRQESTRIIDAFAHKARLGTFDLTIVASARLAGARELLSFDENIKALASVLEIAVFPPLKEQGIERRAQLAKR